MKCRSCNVFKTRNNAWGNVFLDDDGKRWHSFQCPACFNEERKQTRMDKRKLDRVHAKNETITADESFKKIPEFHEKKKCPKCKGKLELSRYFACKKCIVNLPPDAQSEFIYEGMYSDAHSNLSELPLFPGF